jgi:HEPN domain-containing protein
MSASADRHESLRWLATAEEDLRAARVLAAEGMFAHACFNAQQCAEKSVKASWVMLGHDRWGHSVQALIEGFPADQPPAFVRWEAEAATLDRCYIPTRYPNGLPDLTPAETYFAPDADLAIRLAARFLEASREWLASRGAARTS